MIRATLLALAGLAGGALAFILREPSAPKTSFDPAWQQWQTVTGLMLGLCIGMFIGLASGYFQGSRTHLTKGVVLGALIGAAAGTIGISFGALIYGLVQGASFGFISTQLAARIAGWAFMGGLIGLAEGAIGMSWKRAYYGFVGGLIGGGIGGFAFELSATLLGPSQLAFEGRERGEVGTIPRGVGFSLTGLGIGLLIGVVEAISRKAWVRLMLGRNEGKDWPIDASETFFGRSEGVHVPLMGDPHVQPHHACIRREGGRYVLYDLQTPIGIAVNGMPTRQAFLNSGDTFQIGTHTLQFLIRGAPKPAMHTPIQHVQFQQSVAVPAGQTVSMAPAAPLPATPTVMQPAGFQLVATSGPLAGQRFAVTTPVEVGREQSPVPLNFDSGVSRRHARLEPAPDGVMVIDLGSTNGTLVNGKRIQQQLMRLGEMLTIGSTTFRLES